MSGGIADLFRVQKAAEMSQNPMAPEIGRSTSLPPQLLDLVKQATMTEQAQMRMQAQTQQTPQQMPTVADTVRQKSAALMQHQQSQQQDQQQMMQKLAQAQQGGQRFAAGGAVVGDGRVEELLSALERYRRAGADTSGIEQALAHARRQAGAGTPDQSGAEDARLGRQEGLAALAAQLAPDQSEAETARLARAPRRSSPSKAPAAGAPALAAVLDRVSQGGQPRQAPAQAPEQQTPAQQAAPGGAGGQPSPFTALAEKLASEKGEDPDAAIKRMLELRKQFGPQGAEADFIKQQLAQRDEQIAAAGKEKPGITQIITAMARAARNDPKGGWGAGLLGAAEFTQAQKESRKAKVQELQAAKDALLQKMAALQDAKQSGDLQAVVAADADARKAAQDFKAKQLQMVTQFGAQELSGQQAAGRLQTELAAKAQEGKLERDNRVQAARISAGAARQLPAEMQMIERIMAEKKIPFSEAMKEVFGMKQAPKDIASLTKQFNGDPLLKHQYKTLDAFLQAMGVESPGTPKPGGLSAADQALIDKHSK